MFNSSSLKSSITGWWNTSFTPTNTEENSQAEESETKQEKNDQQNSEDIDNKETSIKPETTNADSDSTEKTGEVDANKKNESSTLHLDMTPEEVQQKLTEETKKMVESAKTFGNFLFGVATEASKKVTEKVSETAVIMKNTIEEKTIIGDLNREQEEFLKQKREKQGDAPLPPWVGYQEEEAMKQKIMMLSTDKRNFMRNPPSGVQFQFDFDQSFPIAMATLKEDENLKKMRFELVPKQLKEEVFWRNYFYRVSLIKQSAQLSSLAAMQSSGNDGQSSSSSTSSAVIIGSTNTGTTISRSSSNKSINKSEPDTSSTTKHTTSTIHDADDDAINSDALGGGGQGHQEFISDDFDPSELNPDDLEREMKQLGMEDGGNIPEWEQELQKELQDYEVVGGGGAAHEKSEEWEKEIEDMLNE